MRFALLAWLFLFSFPFAHAGSAGRVEIGAFRSRALVRIAHDGPARPLVILVPGRGPAGPEEMMSGEHTLSRAPVSVFHQLSDALLAGGVNTIRLGKPGVDFYAGNDADNDDDEDQRTEPRFYDEALFQSLRWSQLVDNLAAAVDYARRQPGVDANKIYILGHAEGAQVAADYAQRDPRVKGLLLLGYYGDDASTLGYWRIFQRDVDLYLRTDVDENGDGRISRQELESHPEVRGQLPAFTPSQRYLEVDSARSFRLTSPALNELFSKYREAPLYADGIFNRGPVDRAVAALPQDLYVFNGALDVEAPPYQASQLRFACKHAYKENCYVEIVPGLGHGFSAPRAPRAHPFLDRTFGPVAPEFLRKITELARRFAR